MSSSYFMNLLASAAAVIVGIVIHESAHAAAAWALGDKTARSRGRVSLNPLNHIDPFGTIILPLLMLIWINLTMFFLSGVYNANKN